MLMRVVVISWATEMKRAAASYDCWYCTIETISSSMLTPETLSRLLRRWQEAGWIESERASVRVLQAAALSAIADGEDA